MDNPMNGCFTEASDESFINFIVSEPLDFSPFAAWSRFSAVSSSASNPNLAYAFSFSAVCRNSAAICS